jgi:hypothetical protein
MKSIRQTIVYFEQPGIENTGEVVEIVDQRLGQGDIKNVVVASNSGETGLKFAKKVAKKTNLVIVSSHFGFDSPGVWDFDLKNLRELESMNCKVVTQSHIFSGMERSFTNRFSGVSHSEIIAEAFRSLMGVGMKVAIECAIMAADSGAISMEKTIAVAGTSTDRGQGADCAIVVEPSNCNRFFDFRVLEILAKPFRRNTKKEE